MEEIDKLIHSYYNNYEAYQFSTVSNDSFIPTETPKKTQIQNKSFNFITTASTSQRSCRKELILAKIIISELQEKLREVKNHNSVLDNQLNEALNTIRSIHKDYCTLTERINETNQTIPQTHEREIQLEETKKENQELIEEVLKLKKEKREQDEIYQINLTKLKEQLEDSENKITLKQQEFNEYKSNYSEARLNGLKMENEKLINDKVQMAKKIEELKKSDAQKNEESLKELEQLKATIKEYEKKNHSLSVELKEREIELQKEKKINEQYHVLDQQSTISLQQKDTNYTQLNEQYSNLFNEYISLQNTYEKIKKDSEEKINKLTLDKNALVQKLREQSQKRK